MLEVIVAWACISGNHCNDTYRAYYLQNTEFRQAVEGASNYGVRLQKEYIPSSLMYGISPIAYAVQGKADINLGHERHLVLDLRRPNISYRWNF